jgi:hypothetical protein
VNSWVLDKTWVIRAEINPIGYRDASPSEQLKDLMLAIQIIYAGPPEPEGVDGLKNGFIWRPDFTGLVRMIHVRDNKGRKQLVISLLSSN